MPLLHAAVNARETAMKTFASKFSFRLVRGRVLAASFASLMVSVSLAQADDVASKLLGNPVVPSTSALAKAKPLGLPMPAAAQLKAAGILNPDGTIARNAARKSGVRSSSAAKGTLKGNAGSRTQESVDLFPEVAAPATGNGPVAPMAYGSGEWPFTTSRVELTGRMTNSKTYPYRATGKLFINYANGDTSWCSASLVGRGVIVTAAHCVADFGVGFLNASWFFAPGFYNGRSAQRPVQAVYIVAPSSYINGTDSCAVPGIVCANDIAVIVLKDQRGRYVGTKTGWYGVGYDGFGFTSSGETHITQLGYPGGIDYGTQMLRNDSLGQISPGDSFNTVIGSQMNGGSSGGPWINNFGQAGYPNGVSTPFDAQSNIVVGVSSWGYTDGITDIMGASEFNAGNIIALLNNACTLYPAACAP